MNTLIEVLGILSPADPEIADTEYPEEEFFGTKEERRARSPPTSLIPRVHALLIKDLGEAHPFVPKAIEGRWRKMEREGEGWRGKERDGEGRRGKERDGF
jgi:hypothetical protein